jgi:RNA polymerase sigma-70 factor, ECF subfamily
MPLNRDTAVRLLISGRSSLLGYIYSIVRDWGVTDDIFQEVSILVLKKCGAIRDAAHFGAWARSAARLEAISALRRMNRGPCLLGDAVLNLLDSAWDREQAKEPSAQLKSLRDCMKKLTDRARRILHLRYAKGIKGEALAELLKQPPNTVYVALSRIHQRLAKCVEQQIAEQKMKNDISGPSGGKNLRSRTEYPFSQEDAP